MTFSFQPAIRASHSRGHHGPRKPSTGNPEDAGTGIRPLYISIALTLTTHVGVFPMTKHAHELRTLDSTCKKCLTLQVHAVEKQL